MLLGNLAKSSMTAANLGKLVRYGGRIAKHPFRHHNNRRIKVAMASVCPPAQTWGHAAIRLAAAASARASPA
jgi:hypothetical protein